MIEQSFANVQVHLINVYNKHKVLVPCQQGIIKSVNF